MKTAAITIISKDFSAKARTLCQSLAEHEPGIDRYVLIIDGESPPPALLPKEASLIYPNCLSLPEKKLFFLQYSMLERATALKPWAIEYLLNEGYQAAIYFDSDIKLYSPLSELRVALNCHDIVLTPHTLKPYPDEAIPNETTIHLSGIFNLGFAAFKDSPNVRNALRWWKSKLVHNCRLAPKEGVFLDQSWMNFAPSFFGAYSFNEPGYNVAYWNLHERKIRLHQASDASTFPLLEVNDQPLRFMHFSGFDPTNKRELSLHQTRFEADHLPEEIAALLADYAQSLENNGHQSANNISLDRGHISLKIPQLLRRYLFTPEFSGSILKESPTQVELPSFIIRYFCQPDPEFQFLPLFLGRFYSLRGDVRRNLDITHINRLSRNYLLWFESHGRREGDFDPRFPTLGWWTKPLNRAVQLKLYLQRFMTDAGLR